MDCRVKPGNETAADTSPLALGLPLSWPELARTSRQRRAIKCYR